MQLEFKKHGRKPIIEHQDHHHFTRTKVTSQSPPSFRFFLSTEMHNDKKEKDFNTNLDRFDPLKEKYLPLTAKDNRNKGTRTDNPFPTTPVTRPLHLFDSTSS